MKKLPTAPLTFMLTLVVALSLATVGCDNDQVNADVDRIADELIEEGPGGTAIDGEGGTAAGEAAAADEASTAAEPIDLQPSPCMFQDTQVGYDDMQWVIVTNTWTSEVTITDYGLEMNDLGAVYTVLDQPPTGLTLGVGESCVWAIKFTPDAVRTFTEGFSVSTEYEDEGETKHGASSVTLQGRGVANVSALLMVGWWESTQAGTLMTLDFQVAVDDTTGGQNSISLVNVYIDDMETPAYSSGSVSLAEFPPPPGMIFRRDVTPETHPVMVEVSTADGETHLRVWEVDCSAPGRGGDRAVDEGSGEATDGVTVETGGQECTGQPDCTCDSCRELRGE
jgi:hypothetical protein